jgi:uncharacterized protein (DUF488 family)
VSAAPLADLAVRTVGHSTLPLARFLALLAAHGIERIADVRRHPVSRRHPWFARTALEPALAGAGIAYAHLPELGGHREPRPDSPHVALRVAPFRGYADHMESGEFAAGLARLVALARERRTAVMCAEARWTECHRRLLSDRLVADGAEVVHVREGAEPERHALHPLARIDGGRLLYARASPGLFG